MIRQSVKLLIAFLITFIIFVTMSYAISTTTSELSTIATDPGINVSAQTNSIFTNIVTIFQMIWGVITLGLGLAFVLSLLIGGREDPYGYQPPYGGNQYVQ